MRVLLYEFVTGGGNWSLPGQPPPGGTWLREGAAMVKAVAADLMRIPGCRVTTLLDTRLRQIAGCPSIEIRSADAEREHLRRQAQRSDWTILIAPELEGLLGERCLWCEEVCPRVMPSSGLVSLAADKNVTAQRLTQAGVRTPVGIPLSLADPFPEHFSYPAVLKPACGAGSLDVRYLAQRPSWREDWPPHAQWRLEAFHCGLAASVSMICGRDQRLTLPACRQLLSSDGRFGYRGGSLPLSTELDGRARRLAEAAVLALTADTGAADAGIVGVDLVLAPKQGGEDVVIEVNPRFTTSYVGLREVVDGNIVQAMLQMAEGAHVELSFYNRRVEFDSEGNTRVRELPDER